jgi:hypothetical protein
MPRNQSDFTYDNELNLKVAGLVAATTAGSLILDLGAARINGRVIVDVTACEVASGDEKYEIEVQVSQSASLASGIFLVGCLKLGDSTVNGESADTAVPTRREIAVSNEIDGVAYRYMRLNTRVAGTVATGVNYKAFLVQDF